MNQFLESILGHQASHQSTKTMRKESVIFVWGTSIALNLWFIGQILRTFVPAADSAGMGVWITSVAALLMILLGAIKSVIQWHLLTQGLRIFVIVGSLILAQMSIQVLLRGYDDPLYSFLEGLGWYAAVFLPVLGFPSVSKKVLAIFRWHLLVGVLCTFYFIYTYWHLISADVIRRSDVIEIKNVEFLLYGLFFQTFRVRSEKPFHRLIAVAGLCQTLIISFGTGTRQTIFILVSVLLLSFWIIFRSSDTVQTSLWWRKLFQSIVLLLILAASVGFIYTSLTGAVNLLDSRMSSEADGTSLADNSRIDEIQLLLSQFQLADYFLGRGIRGGFENSAVLKQDNVHIGWFRILLKGGMPLVLFFASSYGALGVIRIASSRKGVVLACASMSVFFIIKNLTGNIILPYGHFYCIAICMGALFVAEGSPNRKPSVSRENFKAVLRFRKQNIS